jgi:anti-anti-sigma factor
MDNVELEVKENTAILKIKNDIIFDNSNQTKEVIKELLKKQEGINNIVIDLAGANYLDSSGIGVILSIFKFTKDHYTETGHFNLVNANEKIKRVFEVTQLDSIIPINDSVN